MLQLQMLRLPSLVYGQTINNYINTHSKESKMSGNDELAKEIVENLSKKIDDRFDALQGGLVEEFNDTKNTIKSKVGNSPIKAVSIAFGIGLVIGYSLQFII